MTANEALSILFEDEDIHHFNDLKQDKYRWILHSLYVGQAAGRIARELGLDYDYARAIGFLHDIGRKINHNNHVIEGYKYLVKHNHPNEARYCITHSFINNIIPNTAGGGPKDRESYDFIKSYLDTINVNIYDNIIQLCDLFCLETGYTTFEKRILDITKRKGVYPNSVSHYESIMELKNRIETMMGKSIYSLFPEIKKEDIDSIDSDYEELMELFKTKKK
jgi:putative nucleotidyltransferase with HDIG domain